MIDVTVKLTLDCDSVEDPKGFARRIKGFYNTSIPSHYIPVESAEVVSVERAKEVEWDVPVTICVKAISSERAWQRANDRVSGAGIIITSVDEPMKVEV